MSAVLSPQTVVELFYQTAARRIIISHIYSQQQSNSLLHWSHMISNVVNLLAQLLYPSTTHWTAVMSRDRISCILLASCLDLLLLLLLLLNLNWCLPVGPVTLVSSSQSVWWLTVSTHSCRWVNTSFILFSTRLMVQLLLQSQAVEDWPPLLLMSEYSDC